MSLCETLQVSLPCVPSSTLSSRTGPPLQMLHKLAGQQGLGHSSSYSFLIAEICSSVDRGSGAAVKDPVAFPRGLCGCDQVNGYLYV